MTISPASRSLSPFGVIAIFFDSFKFISFNLIIQFRFIQRFLNTKYGNDILSLHTDLRTDGRSVYCYSYKELSNNTIGTLGENACGLYYKGNIEIGRTV